MIMEKRKTSDMLFRKDEWGTMIITAQLCEWVDSVDAQIAQIIEKLQKLNHIVYGLADDKSQLEDKQTYTQPAPEKYTPQQYTMPHGLYVDTLASLNRFIQVLRSYKIAVYGNKDGTYLPISTEVLDDMEREAASLIDRLGEVSNND
jgi:hypothetical protein